MPSSVNRLYDNFTRDVSLNTTIWEVNGPVARATIPRWSIPPASVVSPHLTFSPNGMEFSGVNTSFEVAAVQSVGSFSPPFVAEATVSGMVSNGTLFVFAMASADGGQEVLFSGCLNPADGAKYGLWENHYALSIPSLVDYPFWSLFGEKLVSNPSVGTPYNLNMAFGANGQANLTVMNQGKVIGDTSVNVGTGPFYLLLGQEEGLPSTVGSNEAVWGSVSVVGQVPLVSTASVSREPSATTVAGFTTSGMGASVPATASESLPNQGRVFSCTSLWPQQPARYRDYWFKV